MRKKRKVWGEGKHGPVITIIKNGKPVSMKEKKRARYREQHLTAEQQSHLRSILSEGQ